MKHLRIGNIAFWRYDRPGKQFIGARILKVSGRGYPGPGHVQAEGYGPGFWFKVTFCLPPKEGERLLNALAQASSDHGRKVATANAEYKHTIGLLLPAGVKVR